MSAVKWSEKGSKATPVGLDQLMILDSADATDATKNKRITLNALFQDNTGLLTTQGDLLSSTGSAISKRGIGSNGQVLTADDNQTTGLNYTTPATALLTNRGDLLSHDANGIVKVSATSNNGQVLTIDTNADSQLIFKNPTGSAKGNIIVNNGTADPALLPVGTTDGDLLTVDINSNTGLKYLPPIEEITQLMINARNIVYEFDANPVLLQNIPFNGNQTDALDIYNEVSVSQFQILKTGKIKDFVIIPRIISLQAGRTFQLSIFVNSTKTNITTAFTSTGTNVALGVEVSVTAGDLLRFLVTVAGGTVVSNNRLVLRQFSWLYSES